VNTPETTASASTAAKTPSSDVSMKRGIEREVRFAVVMYGGVSLAIYINGVAQELLNMVRATAPDTWEEGASTLLRAREADLPGAIPVYRKLGQYLAVRDQKKRDANLMETAPTTDPIRIRFVVDIISGTSAGGINGVFLAKALARNQTMDGLKKLWLSEGDLGKLLNDKWSIKDLRGFKVKKPQQSLLNSQRMYRKLLEALDNMDTPRHENAPETKYSPLVRELDLFITTTDIDGVPLPISLLDQVVYERRFKNVFHFRYATEEATGSDRDDFIKENDPFLAFAARCTSSFPFAFEATRLSDISEIANAFSPYKDKTSTGDWDRFFSDYLRYGLFDLDLEAHGQNATGHLPQGETEEQAKEQLRASFRDRSFGDGGYLDNKPFSYATAMLSRRYADSAVARKLLYVEPTPEHPELAVQTHEPPDFAENVRAAVLDTGKQLYEGIASLQIGWPDLKTILDREPGAIREAMGRKILEKHERHTALSKLAKIIREGLRRHETLDIQPSNTTIGAAIACVCVNHYKKNFTFYDLVTYPVQYGTGAGETNVVNVFRVSPEDAKSLVDERASGNDATKLAGRALMSFGAFLDESWRRNDMLWGRLDGAERIISALLPYSDDKEVRQWLINEAHLGIINQEIAEGNADAVCRLLSHALSHTKPKKPCGENIGPIVQKVLDQNSGRLNDRQVTALNTPQTLDRQLQHRRALEYISRSTNISGDMFTALADKYHVERGKTVAKWMAQVGSTLWNVIAVAVPQSLGNLFFRHLLGLFYFFAFFLIVVGIFLNNSVKAAGWQLLGVLVLIQLIVSAVGAFICSHRWFMKLLVTVIAIPPVALMILGGRHIAERWSDFRFNRGTELALAGIAAGVVVLFLVLVPPIVRKITNFFRRMRDQVGC
jgi:predicted acylesterase/phospholipase RssA